MQMRFQFDLDKAIEAMAYLVGEMRSVDKVMLMKLLYIANRDHFLQYGVPITGDRLVAMDYGPLPSGCLSAVNGDFTSQLDIDRVFGAIHVMDDRVYPRRCELPAVLSADEKATLKLVLDAHGKKKTWSLVNETHEYPEYKKFYRPGTSTTIPYEEIARLNPNDRTFRLNRPVITLEAAARMASPFTSSGADL